MKRFTQNNSVSSEFVNGSTSVLYAFCKYDTLKSCFSSSSAFYEVQDERSVQITRASCYSDTVNNLVVDVLHANCAYIYMTTVETCISICNTYITV